MKPSDLNSTDDPPEAPAPDGPGPVGLVPNAPDPDTIGPDTVGPDAVGPDAFDDLGRRVDRAMQSDRFRLRRALHSVRTIQRSGRPLDGRVDRLASQIDRSVALRDWRQANRPRCTFDLDLPILACRDEIAAAIRDHQVVVICGETGSGKSTQLPKICLDMGRGIDGMIGHTQPRRVAARTIAARLADELGTTIGQHVGFQIRFTDTTKPETFVKLMTDGILLAETQTDRFMDRYDTLIIDEAHERSLNVDFLLGYLKRILPKRPDLRLIITSATIDSAAFAQHFAGGGHAGAGSVAVPVLEVSGRTYPVEVRYRPPQPDEEGEEPSLADSIAQGINELCREGPGDILVFLPTERDILEVAKLLRSRVAAGLGPIQILPLYARLSIAEQNKVFQASGQRRVVLATNVAESSLTVPGIRYVIDTGTARISRYSPRSKVQRLPIEPVSQASANQRQGRCGRLGPGICLRLFSEQDYLSRDRYTTPEIRRTNLAAVILQMLALRLGAVDAFPFLDPPRPDAVNDGYKTLFELGAIDEHRQLTEMGRQLSRLPIDPRIGRMILASVEEGCVPEILIIAAALEIHDPRDRPADKQKQADERHVQFQHEESDFLGYLKLWDFYHALREKLSRSQLQKACRQNFLSLMRLHEWQDVHRQLRQLVDERISTRRTGGSGPAQPDHSRRDNYDAIHRAVLCGLLSNIATRRERNEYEGGGGTSFFLWPGSGAFAARPPWVVAGELVETSRRYLRTVARIDPGWIERAAAHLLKRSYHDPFWSRKSSTVLAYEKVTLFGLTIVAGRRCPYGVHDPVIARQLFVQHALVEGDFDSQPAFLVANRKLIADLQSLGAKSRTSDYLIGESAQFAFYEQRLAKGIFDAASLNRWLKSASPEEKDRLRMTEADLISGGAGHSHRDFPDELKAGSLRLGIEYRFEPGERDDGLTVTVPREGVPQLPPQSLEWLVPGKLEEKLTALIRSLPKTLRRSLIPAPDVARRAAAELEFAQGDLLLMAARVLSQIAGEPIPASAFDLDKLPPHLRINVRVVDDQGQVVCEGRDLAALLKELGVERSAESTLIEDTGWQQDGLTAWTFGELPARVPVRRGGIGMDAFPAILDQGSGVSLRLVATQNAAERLTRAGARRLFCIAEQRELKSQVRWLPRLGELEVLASTMHQTRPLRLQLMDLLADLAFVSTHPLPRSAEQFEAARQRGRAALPIMIQDIARLLGPLLDQYQQVRVELQDAKAPAWNVAVSDVRSQLAQLIRDNFLAETPWIRLLHFPRYFQGMAVRLAKLRTAGPQRDRESQLLLQPHLERYVQVGDPAETGHCDPELEEYRWMLEEFRISLFAQQLGTATKISPQRLDKQWEKIGSR